MKHELHDRMTLRDIALERPSSIPLLDRLGLDYCCRGEVSLRDAAESSGHELQHVMKRLEAYAEPSEVDEEQDWRRATMTELADQVDRAAMVLRDAGVRAGDRVALVLPNCPQHVVAFYAALRLGAAGAIGVDNDPQALAASRDNAERNGVSAALTLHRPQDLAATAPGETSDDACPVVVANILASALDGLAEALAGRTLPGGRIALSGILDGQEEALLRRYRPWFEQLAVAREGDWVRIDGVRRHD